MDPSPSIRLKQWQLCNKSDTVLHVSYLLGCKFILKSILSQNDGTIPASLVLATTCTSILLLPANVEDSGPSSSSLSPPSAKKRQRKLWYSIIKHNNVPVMRVEVVYVKVKLFTYSRIPNIFINMIATYYIFDGKCFQHKWWCHQCMHTVYTSNIVKIIILKQNLNYFTYKFSLFSAFFTLLIYQKFR